MIDPDTGIVLDDATGKSSETDDWDEEEEEEEPTIEEMKQAIMTFDETFTVPLDETDSTVKAFLDGFDVGSKTEDIAELLKKYPDTLEKTFTLLNSDVKYDDFWKRYFYRCNDEEQILAQYNVYREWKIAEEEKERALKLSRTPVRAGLTSVTNFLGGAVKALVDEGADDPVAPSPFFHSGGQQSTSNEGSATLSFFGGGGRPPFVLNTAVSEDDDDSNGLNEAEEEELGWGSDDEEESDDDDGDGENAVGQIEFRDAEKEKLQEDLDQAVDERDQLQKTVHMQAEEIKALKEAAMDVSGNKQIDSLKMQIFEKDAELAALKARIDDTHEDEKGDAVKEDAEKSAADSRELDRLASELASKDSEVERLKLDLQTVQAQLDSVKSSNEGFSQEQASEITSLRTDLENARSELLVNKSSLEQALSEKSSLEVELQSMRDLVSSLQSDNETLREQSSQVSLAQQQAAEADAHVGALQRELAELKDAVEVANQRASQVENELHAAKQSLADREVELSKEKASPAPPSSPDSMSTGIKVSEEEPTVAKLDADDQEGEDEGWGDDW